MPWGGEYRPHPEGREARPAEATEVGRGITMCMATGTTGMVDGVIAR